MFRDILVPVDLSDRHGRTLDIAAELVKIASGEITLLHVIQAIHGLSVEADPDFYDNLQKVAHEHLDKLLDRLRGHAIAGRSVIRFGERGTEVIRYARENHSDLIVLASHPLDPTAAGKDFMSLSHLIGIGAPCAVLLVK